jgi:beta-galactosidase
MRLGVCYYPEQWQESQWLQDAQMMRELGLRIIRIGVFTWTKLEPKPGIYDWDWFDQVISIFETVGLQVVIATPTAAPPAWLVHQHPEILPVNENGIQWKFGSGFHFCPNSTVYKTYVEKIVTALGKRYGSNATIIGWQIDNAFGSSHSTTCYCEGCDAAFQKWLQERYETIEQLNNAWGTIYLNQTYTSWEEVHIPNPNNKSKNPSHQLDYFRFSSFIVQNYAAYQIDLLKNHTKNQFVTHNFSYQDQNLDITKLSKFLDFVSWNSSPTGYAEMLAPLLYLPGEKTPDLAYEVGDPYITGFFHAWTRGICVEPFWVMEQQIGQIDWGKVNPGIRPGTIRLWTWHAVANGAEAVLFQRWRATRYGSGQFQSAFLRHDGSFDLGYAELSSMKPEAPVMTQLKDEPIKSTVAILVNYEDMWALDFQPHNDQINYQRVLFNYYRALSRLGISVDLVPIDKDLAEYRLVIAPILYLTDQELVNRLEAYVARGGAIVFGPRSGFKTVSNLVSEQSLPGALRSLVGGWVSDWQSLPDDVNFPFRSDIHGLRGEAGNWIEAIHPDENEGVKILARYLGGPLAGSAAITEHAYGAGVTYYIGFNAKNEQIKQILGYLVSEICNENVLDLPDGVVVNQRGNHRIAFNFTRNEKTIVLDDKMTTIPPRDFRFFLRDWS